MKPRWVEIMESVTGVRETPGPEATPMIIEFDKHTTLKATSDEVAWCSSCMNYVMDTAGYPGTHSAAARSWLSWGIGLKCPIFGCIAVLDRSDPNNKNAAHVTLYVGDVDKTRTFFYGRGGNQDDQVKVSIFSKSRVLGWRWPDGAELPEGSEVL